MDRLGRSIKHLITIVNDFKDQGINFVSLTESINTDTVTGNLIFNIFASLADFERNLIIERTKAGLEAARARGKVGGRKKKLNDKKEKHALDLYHSKKHTIAEICDLVGISAPTLYKYINSVCSKTTVFGTEPLKS